MFGAAAAARQRGQLARAGQRPLLVVVGEGEAGRWCTCYRYADCGGVKLPGEVVEQSLEALLAASGPGGRGRGLERCAAGEVVQPHRGRAVRHHRAPPADMCRYV